MYSVVHTYINNLEYFANFNLKHNISDYFVGTHAANEMSLNPLNELKRRLEDDDTPLPKRLCLAKNVVQSNNFPSGPKERVVSEWLNSLMKRNRLCGEELRKVLQWLNMGDDLTSQLKSNLIQVVSEYIGKNPIENDDIVVFLSFLENDKMSLQLSRHLEEFITISMILLQHLNNEEISHNSILIKRVLHNIARYYKDCKKKLEFIEKLLDGENIECIFSFLHTDCHDEVINLCQSIFFPHKNKSFFVSFLQTLIRKENIEDLIAEKGENIQSVLKIMGTFFTFPKGRTSNDPKFLSNFINVFVSCYKSESQMIFAFYIMITNSLNMTQSYIIPTMTMPPIKFEANEDKIKRNIFLNMLEYILNNDVDINVRLTDTFGEKISKIEIKKNFLSFLQVVMLSQLKLEGKVDKTTLNIVKIALKLDPSLIEQKLDVILPPLMIAKKNTCSITESYIEMLNCLLEILFKLSRGTRFVTQILPHVKLCLEAANTEQFELKQKISECTENSLDCEKLKSKLLNGSDLFPQACVEVYGKLTTELMFRQNNELLQSLHKDIEEHCLLMLEEGFVSPSIITLAEVLSSILCSFLRYNKMADHTVPLQIAKEFWDAFKNFENECLKKFGECVLKLNYNPPLVAAFLQLCLSVGQLKLLNLKYGNTKLDMPEINVKTIYDLNFLLPCLSSKQWSKLYAVLNDDVNQSIFDNLLLLKTIALELISVENKDMTSIENVNETKSHLIGKMTNHPETLLVHNYVPKVLFNGVNTNDLKQVAKCILNCYISNGDTNILYKNDVLSNRTLQNVLVLETLRNVSKNLENTEKMAKNMNKADFNFVSFIKDVDCKEFLCKAKLKENYDSDVLSKYVDVLKILQLPYLEENYQLTAIFVMLALKKCSQSKKLKRSIDNVLQKTFELSPKYPDLYKIFTVDAIFSFSDTTLIELLTLTLKNCNNMLIIKSILESGVKKVKTDSEIVKKIVEILLSKHKKKIRSNSSIEYFSDPVFQISCIILPIIAKEKRAITTSAYRSILANLQEKLHEAMLEAFKKIDFSSDNSIFVETPGNTDDSVVMSDHTVATLNAMEAYTLTLAKYCEATDAEEVKNLKCLWSGLPFFIHKAIETVQSNEAKKVHIDSSIHLFNTILRYIKKLESHELFQKKDELFKRIWQCIKSRLLIMFDGREKTRLIDSSLNEIAVTLKFLCELASVECFINAFVGDLSNLTNLKVPSSTSKEGSNSITLTSHRVAKYLWTNCLKANIVGPKCVAMTKLMFRNSRNIRYYIENIFDGVNNGEMKREDKGVTVVFNEENEVLERSIVVEDTVCDLLKLQLDSLSEVILAAKKISLDYKFMDAIFDLQHVVHCVLGCKSIGIRCKIGWQSFFNLFEGCVSILNSLIVSREEILEDRWPCYMQCYRTLVLILCERSTSQENIEKDAEEKLAEVAHSVEKITQSICKRKTHICRLAAYTVADICSCIEKTSPLRMVRQHLENSVALLIQASDSSYAIAFLKRALAGSAGQMTMSNLYTMYKRYHKYVGNA